MFANTLRVAASSARTVARARPLPLKQNVWALSSRGQASVASASEPANTATNRAQATLQRFWKSVGIEQKPTGENLVTLDKRSLKTPSGNPLVLPKDRSLAAILVAQEWENQEKVLKQHSLPMTSLASRAIDGFPDEETKAQVREQLLKYLETDTICFHASAPPSLVALERKHWDPIIAWVTSNFGVEIAITESFHYPVHPPETFAKLDEVLAKMDNWELAAIERATYASKSFLIGLALVHRQITADEAAQAAHVEVNDQIEKWGEVEDTHDVDYHDMRRQLGSVSCLLAKF